MPFLNFQFFSLSCTTSPAGGLVCMLTLLLLLTASAVCYCCFAFCLCLSLCAPFQIKKYFLSLLPSVRGCSKGQRYRHRRWLIALSLVDIWDYTHNWKAQHNTRALLLSLCFFWKMAFYILVPYLLQWYDMLTETILCFCRDTFFFSLSLSPLDSILLCISPSRTQTKANERIATMIWSGLLSICGLSSGTLLPIALLHLQNQIEFISPRKWKVKTRSESLRY